MTSSKPDELLQRIKTLSEGIDHEWELEDIVNREIRIGKVEFLIASYIHLYENKDKNTPEARP